MNTLKTIAADLMMENSKQRLLDVMYLKIAHLIAEQSYCVKRHVGAIIVKDGAIISTGYNGTISGFENVCEYRNAAGEIKTKAEVLHAESNAITKVACSTISTEGSTIYVTCAPCIECAKLIIQSKISRVVYDTDYSKPEGLELLRKAGVQYEQINVD